MTTVPTVTLNNSTVMPQLGFGVWQVADDAAEAAVTEALKVGYRSIDTAAMYRNEAGVGRALAAADVDRSDVFVTTKLNNDGHGYDATMRAFDDSLDKLGLDYVNLYLIHWPQAKLGKFVDSWRAFEKILADGRAKAIGVSNFTNANLQTLFDATDIVPAVDQIECHPYLQQDDMRAFDNSHGIATEAWSPLGQGGALLSDQTVTKIAADHGRSAAQVVLRWHIQRGNIVIPKSVTPSRIAENFDIFTFELSAQEMAAIGALDRDGRIGPHPDTVVG